MAPQPPSEPSSMDIGIIKHTDDKNRSGKVEIGATAAFTTSSDFTRGHLFSPVESSIDPTMCESTAVQDMTRPPLKMKEPRPSTMTKTPYFNTDPTATNTATNTSTNASQQSREITPKQHHAATSGSDDKSTASSMNHLQQAMTSESKMSRKILLQQAMKYQHKTETSGSDEKIPVLPRSHLHHIAASEAEMIPTKILPAVPLFQMAATSVSVMIRTTVPTESTVDDHTVPSNYPQLLMELINTSGGETPQNVLQISFSHFSHPPYSELFW